ncbi:receptor-like protein kinase FERONIA [Salvia hispanica]|uniref:receptor-like protein kinase FERONIA n=1 Tax=Salvia hispanica TaxID=49212 RepID=UPI00200941CA|nr:receptor-like protein kinase FERONIA [Salvia hispanica]
MRVDSQILLNCGASVNEAIDSSGRKWIPDSKFLTTNDSLSSTANSQDPSLPSTVPYMHSRIFKSETTYKFPISPTSRHWLRLHFYPSSYDQFDSASAFFSVSAAGFTLLHNFSASLTAQSLTQAYLITEFTINHVNSPLLRLTFTPLLGFAFINGIEIVPTPEIFPPQRNAYAMQTMFRLNVGGQFFISDSPDSRTWYDDSPHIYGAGFGLAARADSDVAVAYPSPEFKLVAPPDVYKTARTMGPNSTLNVNYNLTWILDVDANFTYLVRLHFCDFIFGKVNQRVFFVFINNRTVETDADVVAWAGGRGAPVYKDYRVGGDNQIWLALHPNPESKPQYYDSILNGIEVFKLNDTKGSLAGPNPIPSPNESATATHASRSRKSVVVIVLSACVVAAFGVVFIVGFLKHRKTRGSEEGVSWIPIYGSWSRSSGSSSSQMISSRLCRHFSLGEMRGATNGFSESCVVGVGGFGKVYRGCIDGNATEVAVKRAHPSSQQGLNEFLNEIELLSKLRHRHLVSLIGACEENNEMILVYDYMANGTLREHLYDKNNDSTTTTTTTTLSWKQRLGICIGAARGIHYLHTGAKHPIIHRDVKTTNILLDDKWVAKVSDFGLSKTGHGLDQAHVSTVVKGSFGYLDPEYYRLQQLTDKSDVYSLGVVLLEVLCARPPIDPSLPNEQICLADWALRSYSNGGIHEMIDPRTRGEINPECLKHYIETALNCLSHDSVDRPSMGQVLSSLEYCLKLQIGE